MSSSFLVRSSLSCLATLLFLAAACSGKSVVDAPHSTSSSSSSNSTSTSSNTTTTNSGETTGSTGPQSCKGWNDPSCGPEAFCAVPPNDCDGVGVCEPRPTDCDDGCTGICGCDGEVHCSACAANFKGVSVKDGDCETEQAIYEAKLWLGGLDHLIISKKNLATGTCLLLFADWPTMGAPELSFDTPEGWGVNQIIATNLASDCDSVDMQIKGETVQASAGKGVIKWTVDPGKYYPCELDIDAAVQFDKPPAWLKSEHVMLSHIKVQDGCF